MATLSSAIPAIDHGIFEWAPDEFELLFVDGTSIYRFDGVTTRILGRPGSLDPVQELSTSRGHDLSDAHLRFSPSGRLIAAGISGATGVFRRDGSLVRLVVGGFDGWAGNRGVLTLALERESSIVLRLHPMDGSASRKIEDHFKGQVATDPKGDSFAYFDANGFLVFRHPDGTMMRKLTFLRFLPTPVAAISTDRRTSPSAGVYSSSWSR